MLTDINYCSNQVLFLCNKILVFGALKLVRSLGDPPTRLLGCGGFDSRGCTRAVKVKPARCFDKIPASSNSQKLI